MPNCGREKQAQPWNGRKNGYLSPFQKSVWLLFLHSQTPFKRNLVPRKGFAYLSPIPFFLVFFFFWRKERQAMEDCKFRPLGFLIGLPFALLSLGLSLIGAVIWLIGCLLSCLCPCCFCFSGIPNLAINLVILPVKIIQWFIDLIPCWLIYSVPLPVKGKNHHLFITHFC